MAQEVDPWVHVDTPWHQVGSLLEHEVVVVRVQEGTVCDPEVGTGGNLGELEHALNGSACVALVRRGLGEVGIHGGVLQEAFHPEESSLQVPLGRTAQAEEH